MPQQLNIYRKLILKPGAIVEGSWNGAFDRGGRTYYVNNITGASTNDGLGWNSAMDEVSTAITASETYRQLQGNDDNDYIRNTIVVQGTATAYSYIEALPSYCDIIGLGASPLGNGSGIARLDGLGAKDAAATDEVRGLNIYNMQFTHSVSGSFWAMDLAVVFRSIFEHCAFLNGLSGGLKIVRGGSVTIDDCLVGGGDSFNPVYGLYVGTGTSGDRTFNSCLLKDSHFHGTTAAFHNSNVGCSDTWARDCLFEGGVHGFVDVSTDSNLGDNIKLSRCYGFGTHSTSINEAGFEITVNYAKRAFGCIDNANGTLFAYPKIGLTG